uniref:Uncharacterized protein n=1 Tax=Macaca mulatta TaxID=9544 RepID=A0A5F7ZWB9_MACMU
FHLSPPPFLRAPLLGPVIPHLEGRRADFLPGEHLVAPFEEPPWGPCCSIKQGWKMHLALAAGAWKAAEALGGAWHTESCAEPGAQWEWASGVGSQLDWEQQTYRP